MTLQNHYNMNIIKYKVKYILNKKIERIFNYSIYYMSFFREKRRKKAMKKLFEKHFERTWLIIFLVMFVFIMIPFPFFYSETYIPAFGGIPLYVFGWIVYAVITFALIIIYYRMCMKRKEYHTYDEEDK